MQRGRRAETHSTGGCVRRHPPPAARNVAGGSWRTQRRLARLLPRQPMAGGGRIGVPRELAWLGQGAFSSSRPRHRLVGRRAPCTERQSSGPAIIDGVPRAKSSPRRGFACDGLGSLRAGQRRPTARTAIRRSVGRDDETGDRDVQPLWRKASVIRHPLAVHVAPSVASPTPVGGPRGRRCSCPAPVDLHIGHPSRMDEAIVGWGATVLYVGARCTVKDLPPLHPLAHHRPVAAGRRRPPSAAAGRHCRWPAAAHAAAVKQSTQCWQRR